MTTPATGMTMATTSPTTSATATATETATATATEGSTGDTATTGPLDPECVDASDCQLFETCCDCEAIPLPGMGVDSCPGVDCESGWCAQNGVEKLECRYGRCTIVEVSCNPNGVVCAVAPPDCEPPLVPGTADGCWTGQCIAPELCDWVPSCDACPDDQVCVSIFPGPKGPTTSSCEPVPAGCGAIASCECGGEELCFAVGGCFDAGENHVNCIGK